MPLVIRRFAAVALLLLAAPLVGVTPTAAFVAVPGAGRVIAPPGVSDPVEYARRLREAEARDAAGDTAAVSMVEELAQAYPEDGRTWLRVAAGRYRLHRYAEATDAYAHALDLGFGRVPSVLYNMACCEALAGHRDRAIHLLERSLAAGFENRPSIRNDADLASLRGDPRFAAIAGFPPDTIRSRVAGWRYDLDFLYREITRLHRDEGQSAPLPSIRAGLDSLAARVPRLGDERIPFEMQRVVRRLGDGHSVVYPMARRIHPTQLPVTLYWFPEGLFVVGADSAHRDLVGTRVLRIGRGGSARFAADLAPIVNRDNPMGILWLGPLYLTFPETLAGLGYVDRTDAVPLTVVPPGGAVRTATLAPGPVDIHRSIGPPTTATGPPPLWLQHVQKSYWMKELPADSALYVQVNQIRNARDETLAAFSSRLTETLRRTGVRKLVVDLRRNNGGNSFLNDALVRALITYEAEAPDGRLYVVIGRNTFSAAMNLTTDIERWTHAIFVGEPTGSRPNAVAEDTDVELPWSGVRASISSRYHQESYPGDDRIWIPPDVPVVLTSSDYFANRDPVMDAIRALWGGPAPAGR